MFFLIVFLSHGFSLFLPLRGRFQYGEWHFGHSSGCSTLSVHVCPHLRHLAVGSVMFLLSCGSIITYLLIWVILDLLVLRMGLFFWGKVCFGVPLWFFVLDVHPF